MPHTLGRGSSLRRSASLEGMHCGRVRGGWCASICRIACRCAREIGTCCARADGGKPWAAGKCWTLTLGCQRPAPSQTGTPTES